MPSYAILCQDMPGLVWDGLGMIWEYMGIYGNIMGILVSSGVFRGLRWFEMLYDALYILKYFNIC
jgi:hypothetical protein